MPVAGSSATPRPGANIRLYAVAPSAPGCAEKRNTPFDDTFDDCMKASNAAAPTLASSTALRVASGTNTNGTPHDTSWTGCPVAATASGDSDSAAAAADGSSGSPKTGVFCVIHAKLRSSPFHVSVT